MKRLCLVLIAIVFLLAIVPSSVLAFEIEPYSPEMEAKPSAPSFSPEDDAFDYRNIYQSLENLGEIQSTLTPPEDESEEPDRLAPDELVVQPGRRPAAATQSIPAQTGQGGMSFEVGALVLYPEQSYAPGVVLQDALVEPASLIWRSSNPEIVWVSAEGVVTGLARGSAVVQASTKDGSAYCMLQVTVKGSPALSSVLQTERYADDLYRLDRPVGWQSYTSGSQDKTNLIVYDPDEKARQLFYLSEIGPFYTNAMQYALDVKYMMEMDCTVPWIDAPVVTNMRADYFFSKYNNLIEQYAAQMDTYFPRLSDFQVISYQNTRVMVEGCKTTGIVYGTFMQDGAACAGVFATSMVEKKGYTGEMGGSLGYAYMTVGVAAPISEFTSAADAYFGILDSLNLDTRYFATNDHTIAQLCKELRDFWNKRDPFDDVSAQQWADEQMAQERLYDVESGTVYLVPAGFYETYDARREKYQMQHLIRVSEQIPALWLLPTKNASNLK